MKLAIDIDGCLAKFSTPFHALLVSMHGMRNQPEGYNPEVPPVWEWPRLLGYTVEEELAAWEKVWNDPLWWAKLEEFDGASQAIALLDRLSFEGHDVYYITHRKGVRVKQQTERWLEARGSYNPTVLIAGGDKIPIFRELRIDAIVDDKKDTLNRAAREVVGLAVYAKNTLHNIEDRYYSIIGVNSVLEMVHDVMRAEQISIPVTV